MPKAPRKRLRFASIPRFWLGITATWSAESLLDLHNRLLNDPRYVTAAWHDMQDERNRRDRNDD